MLLTGSGRLAPAGMSPWAIQVRDGRISWIGSPGETRGDDESEDLGSALVTPGMPSTCRQTVITQPARVLRFSCML